MPGGRSARRESAEADLQQVDQLSKMTEVIAQALRQPRQEGGFKAPKYDGTDDVEMFITQFQEVADANGWTDRSALLHLREVLKDGARACGRGDTVDAIFAALRIKYGLTVREARSRLTKKKDVRTSLQEHASEIERLANIAYADLPEHHRDSMALDAFSLTLGNLYLQRHLLAVKAETLADAVKAGNEFLQVQASQPTLNQRSTVMSIDEEGQMSSEVVQVDVATTESVTMHDILAALKQLTTSLVHRGGRSRGRGRPPHNPQQSDEKSTNCWECGAPGHFKRQCPQLERTQTSETPQPGNKSRPQQ